MLVDFESPLNLMGGFKRFFDVRKPSSKFQIPPNYFNATMSYRTEADYYAPYDMLVPTSDDSLRWSENDVRMEVLISAGPCRC